MAALRLPVGAVGLGKSLLVLALVAVSVAAQSADASWDDHVGRSLLQSQGGSGSGPKTAVITNVNSNLRPVYCVNVTLPFVNETHSASGETVPPPANVTALASAICKDFSAAGRSLYAYFSRGGSIADIAAAAVGAANCSSSDAVPNAITVAVVAAQDAAKGVGDVESFSDKMVKAFSDVGIPACVTVLESDDSGTKVAKESYYKTS